MDHTDLCPHLGWSALTTLVICALIALTMYMRERRITSMYRSPIKEDLLTWGWLFAWSATLSLTALLAIGLVSLFVRPALRIEVAGLVGAIALILAICFGDVYMSGRFHRDSAVSDWLFIITVVLIATTGIFGLAAFFRQLFMNLH